MVTISFSASSPMPTKNRHVIILTKPTKFLFCLIEMETNWIYSTPQHSCFLCSHAMLLPSSSHLWGGSLGDSTKGCIEGQTYVSSSLKYSRLPITRTFKGNRKRFKLSGVRVIRHPKKIAGSKEKKQFLLHSEHFNHI